MQYNSDVDYYNDNNGIHILKNHRSPVKRPIYTALTEIDCIGCTLTFHRPLVQFVRDAGRESLGALRIPDVAQLLDEV